MNKDDKAFISGLFNSLEGKITGLEAQGNGMMGKITRLEAQMKSNEDAIRYNGILLERQSDLMYAIGENVTTLNDKYDRTEARISKIEQDTIDLPVIRKMVKKHEKQLAALQK